MKPTHVTINGTSTYRLGRIHRSGSRGREAECLDMDDGLVRRMCYWSEHLAYGSTVKTHGDTLHFHGPGQAKARVAQGQSDDS
jgi:hypothetical protein